MAGEYGTQHHGVFIDFNEGLSELFNFGFM